MIEALVWLAIGISIGWTASRMSDAEREAESWGKHLQAWDGADEQTVYHHHADPYDQDLEGSRRVDRDVLIRRPRRWNP